MVSPSPRASNPRPLCVFQLKERISLRKHEDERLALRSQMNVEEAERRLIEDLKAEAKEKAEVGLHVLFAWGQVAKQRLDVKPGETTIFAHLKA